MRPSGFSFAVLVGLSLAGAMTLAGTANAGAPSVASGVPCHDYAQIVETLGERYGEAPVSLGLQSNGHVLQVFTSPESGSWTILSVAPTGVGCIVAAGKSWMSRPTTSTDPSA